MNHQLQDQRYGQQMSGYGPVHFIGSVTRKRNAGDEGFELVEKKRSGRKFTHTDEFKQSIHNAMGYRGPLSAKISHGPREHGEFSKPAANIEKKNVPGDAPLRFATPPREGIFRARGEM